MKLCFKNRIANDPKKEVHLFFIVLTLFCWVSVFGKLLIILLVCLTGPSTGAGAGEMFTKFKCSGAAAHPAFRESMFIYSPRAAEQRERELRRRRRKQREERHARKVQQLAWDAAAAVSASTSTATAFTALSAIITSVFIRFDVICSHLVDPMTVCDSLAKDLGSLCCVLWFGFRDKRRLKQIKLNLIASLVVCCWLLLLLAAIAYFLTFPPSRRFFSLNSIHSTHTLRHFLNFISHATVDFLSLSP